MAKTAKPASPQVSAPAAAGEAPRPAPSAGRPAQRRWLRSAIIFFIVFCLMGIIPLALASETLGGLRLPKGSLPFLSPGSSAPKVTLDTPLVHPAPMRMKAATHILSQPVTGASLALLQPDFAVSVTQYAQAGSARWAHVAWSGPTATSGGAGWASASALQAPSGSVTGSTGDLGALSPGLNQQLAGYGGALVAVVYFPATHALYLTSNAQQSIPIGGGFRAILLADLYAQAEKPGAKSVPASLAGGVALGDPVSAAAAYQQLGGGGAVSAWLLSVSSGGITPATGDWRGATAIPQALLTFYSRLYGGSIVSANDLTTIQRLIASANATAAVGLIRPDALGSGGALTLDSGDDTSGASGQGAWASASGLLSPTSGPQAVVVVFGRNQSSTSAAQSILRAFFGQLSIVLAG